MNSIEDLSKTFYTEYKKLNNLIRIASSHQLSIPEIVDTYYQIINVSSMCTTLKQFTESDPNLMKKITETEQLISETFNSSIHPKILATLTTSINEKTKNLQSMNSKQKSKDEIEQESKLFEELRQAMSTKEFVEQYDKGL